MEDQENDTVSQGTGSTVKIKPPSRPGLPYQGSSQAKAWDESQRGQFCFLFDCCFTLTHLSLSSSLWDIGKHHSPRCDAAERGVPSGAILFA